MSLAKKFLDAPKHALDLKHQKKLTQKVNSLLNGMIVDEKGNAIGQILYAEGNTVFQIWAGTNGWHFEDKIEVNPARGYQPQTVIHIQETDSLVTTGIRDAANLIAHPDGSVGSPIKSCAGFWVSTRSVPAKQTVDSKDFWNLPQYPLPNPSNLDDEKNYWIYLGEMNC